MLKKAIIYLKDRKNIEVSNKNKENKSLSLDIKGPI